MSIFFRGPFAALANFGIRSVFLLPEAISDVTISAIRATQATLSFALPFRADGIEVAVNGGAFRPLAAPYILSDLIPSTAQTVRLRGVNPYGAGPEKIVNFSTTALQYATLDPLRRTMYTEVMSDKLSFRWDGLLLNQARPIVRGTNKIEAPSQKLYLEVDGVGRTAQFFGFSDFVPDPDANPTQTTNIAGPGSLVWNPYLGNVYRSGNLILTNGSPKGTTTCTMGIAYSNEYVWFSVNGQYVGGGNPIIPGSGFPYAGLSYPQFQVEPTTPNLYTVNFGAKPFKYAPAGFSGWIV